MSFHKDLPLLFAVDTSQLTAEHNFTQLHQKTEYIKATFFQEYLETF
jgi:hypothetical protein